MRGMSPLPRSDRMGRRTWLAAAATVVAGGCSRRPSRAEERERAEAKASAEKTVGSAWRDEAFDVSADAPDGELAAIFAPDGSADWPVLVALHGRGEAGRGLAAGAHGWRDDYDLDVVRANLERGAITRADSKDFLSPARVARIAAALSTAPFGGLRVACPYCPVPSGDADPFGRFITGPLLDRVGALPAGTPPSPPIQPIPRSKTGIDGVSMGGRYALEIGFGFAASFGAVGALQPAIREEEADAFATRAERARDLHGKQAIQLVTSAGDPFRAPTEALSEALKKRGVEHDLQVTDGPHDYIWNRGPGAIEMLVFHDRVLRGLAPA